MKVEIVTWLGRNARIGPGNFQMQHLRIEVNETPNGHNAPIDRKRAHRKSAPAQTECPISLLAQGLVSLSSPNNGWSGWRIGGDYDKLPDQRGLLSLRSIFLLQVRSLRTILLRRRICTRSLTLPFGDRPLKNSARFGASEVRYAVSNGRHSRE